MVKNEPVWLSVLLSKSKSAEAVKKMARLACLLLQAPAESLSVCGHESVLMPCVLRQAGCFVLREAQTSHACPHIGRLWGHTWNGWTLIMSFWLQLRSCRGILCESELIWWIFVVSEFSQVKRQLREWQRITVRPVGQQRVLGKLQPFLTKAVPGCQLPDRCYRKRK